MVPSQATVPSYQVISTRAHGVEDYCWSSSFWQRRTSSNLRMAQLLNMFPW
jgi:hypothetical protein